MSSLYSWRLIQPLYFHWKSPASPSYTGILWRTLQSCPHYTIEDYRITGFVWFDAEIPYLTDLCNSLQSCPHCAVAMEVIQSFLIAHRQYHHCVVCTNKLGLDRWQGRYDIDIAMETDDYILVTLINTFEWSLLVWLPVKKGNEYLVYLELIRKCCNWDFNSTLLTSLITINLDSFDLMKISEVVEYFWQFSLQLSVQFETILILKNKYR